MTIFMALLSLATLNCLTLSKDARIIELENALDKIKYDIVGLSEVRRKSAGEMDLSWSNGRLYHSARLPNHTAGVGFIVSGSVKQKVVRFCVLTARICFLDVAISDGILIRVFQIYAPASIDMLEYSTFIHEVEQAFHQPVTGSHRYRFVHKVILGDFNGKVGVCEPGEQSVGNFGYGNRNDKGQIVVDLCERLHLRVGNSLFRKRDARKFTWVSPNGRARNEIDFILFPKGIRVMDVDVVNRLEFSTDHRMVRSFISFPFRFRRGRNRPAKGDAHLEKDLFKFSLEAEMKRVGGRVEYGTVVSAVQTAGKIATTFTPSGKRVSQKTRDLLIRRRELKIDSVGVSRVEWLLVNRAIRESFKADRDQGYLNYINEAIRMGKGFKRAPVKLAIGRERISRIRNGNGDLELTQAGIVEAFQSFYNNLYKGDGGIGYREVIERDPFVPICASEVDQVLRHFKSGKAPGKDRITGEMLRIGVDQLVPTLTTLFNNIIMGNIPQGFGDSRTILLPKTGDATLPKNYRPISLLPVLQKALTGLLNKRYAPVLDRNKSWEQMGFRQGHSTIDAIHTLKSVIAHCVDYRLPIYLLFVDISKAFDSVFTEAVFRSVEMEGIPSEVVSFLAGLSQGSKNALVVNGSEVEIKVGRGVRQGDCLSPRLFTAVLDRAFRQLDWSKKGICINGRFLSHILFADDAVIISHDERQIQSMAVELEKVLAGVGLQLNGDKTIGMTSKPLPRIVKVAGKVVKLQEKVVYLGSGITINGTDDWEITRRIQAGYGAFHKHRSFLINRGIPMAHKRRLFNGCILPAVLYGCECWALTNAQMNRLSVAQRRMERWMVGCTVLDHVSNERLRDSTRIRDFVRDAQKRKWFWLHKIANDDNWKWSRSVIEWFPTRKRRRGRPMTRWSDIFRKTVGPNFLNEARKASWNAMHIRALT